MIFKTKLDICIFTGKQSSKQNVVQLFSLPACHENPFQNVDLLQIMNGGIGAGNIYDHAYCWRSEVVKQLQMD